MAITIGFNFRATLGGATDSTNQIFVDKTDIYPKTYTVASGSVTGGWVTTGPASSRDRTPVGGVTDPRVKGVHFDDTASRTFRVDLPATGDYILGCACGDPQFAPNIVKFDIKDNTTTLVSVNHNPATGLASGQLYDVTDVKRTSPSDWVTNQATVTKTFSSTILNFVQGWDATNGGNELAHLYISQVAAAPPAPQSVAFAMIG